MSKKQEILDTALRLFASQGVGNTATAQITTEAGVAEGTLFVHFKNKQALVDEVYRHTKEKEAQAFQAVLDPAKSAEENVRALATTIVEHFLTHYDELQFLQHVMQLDLITPQVRTEAYDYFSEMGQFIKTAQKNGEIKSLEALVLCNLMWSTLIAITVYAKQHNKKVTKAMIDPVWDMLKA